MTTKKTFSAIFFLSLVTALGVTGGKSHPALFSTANAPQLLASSEQVEVAERGSGRIDGDSTSFSIQEHKAS